MAKFAALYRGINVGGKNSVKMEALRAMHERLGHRDVQSYIQSGNVVFAAKGTSAAIAKKTLTEFVNEFGFAAKVLVVGAEDWEALVQDNPFAKFAAKDPKTVHVGLCEGEPNEKGLQELLANTGGPEKFVVGNGVVYLYAPAGFGTSKFAAGMDKACGVPMTARNWRTIESLMQMLNEMQ